MFTHPTQEALESTIKLHVAPGESAACLDAIRYCNKTCCCTCVSVYNVDENIFKNRSHESPFFSRFVKDIIVMCLFADDLLTFMCWMCISLLSTDIYVVAYYLLKFMWWILANYPRTMDADSCTISRRVTFPVHLHRLVGGRLFVQAV